jgi:hypothetical protein
MYFHGHGRHTFFAFQWGCVPGNLFWSTPYKGGGTWNKTAFLPFVPVGVPLGTQRIPFIHGGFVILFHFLFHSIGTKNGVFLDGILEAVPHNNGTLEDGKCRQRSGAGKCKHKKPPLKTAYP